MTMSAVEKAALLPPTLTIWRHCASDFRYRRVTFWPGQAEITSGYQVMELPQPPSWCLPKFGKQQQCCWTPPPCLRPPNSVQHSQKQHKKTLAVAQYRHHPAKSKSLRATRRCRPNCCTACGPERMALSWQDWGPTLTQIHQPVPQKQCHDVV